MFPSKLLLTAAIIVLTAGHAWAQDDSLNWWWSPGLGLYASTINEALAKDLSLPRNKGLLVLAVARGSAADKAGLKPGDILSEWSPREIWAEGGKVGTIQIVRDGTAQSIAATSVQMPADSPVDLVRNATTTRDAMSYVVDAQGGGSFRTVTAALFRAQAGDSVVLKPGLYKESVLLPPGVGVRAEEKSLARIESKAPWIMIGPAVAELSGIVFSQAGLIIENGENVTVSDCEFGVSEKKIGLVLNNAKATVVRSTFRGSAGSTGISMHRSQAQVADSILMAHGNAAIVIAGDSKAEVSGNLMDGNRNGVFVNDSEFTANKNVMSGSWSSDSKETTPDFGFRLEKSRATLRKNVIRRHRYGILVTEAPLTTSISEGTVTQAEYGIVLIGSPATVNENLIMQNLRAGIYISRKEEKDNPSPTARHQVSILRNTLSSNEGMAILIDKFQHVSVNENLIEANTTGVDLNQSGATIENNTMVLQRFAGVNLRARSDARIFNNVVAFNSFGLFIDVTAKSESGYNNVYGNLASTEFPLLDGNYGRADRYVTRDGKKVPIDVYPAYDLKAETDVSIDPGFVKLGSDYNLLPVSAIANIRGKEGRYLGAYAPESYVARSGVRAEEQPVKTRSTSRRGRTVKAATVNAVAATTADAASSARRRGAVNPLSAEAKALIERGNELMERSRWADAIAAYQQAIQTDPNNAKAHNGLGWAYNRMSRHGEAFPPLVKAIQLDPQLADAHYGIAYAYLGSDNYAKAMAFLKTAVRLDPRNAEARFSLGEAYLEIGNRKGAMEQYVALKDLDAKLAEELLAEIKEMP